MVFIYNQDVMKILNWGLLSLCFKNNVISSVAPLLNYRVAIP